MDNRPVVFLDSGVGGLPYLAGAREKLPGQIFVYLADNANFPYGEKDVQTLISIVLSVIDRIVEAFNPKAVVIACNTASVITLSSLREKYGIPFIGVVPAVKPAAEYTKNGRIGLLATEATVRSVYTDNLIKEFADGLVIKKFAGVKIVDFVENYFYQTDEKRITSVLKPAVDFFIEEKVDTLILACTHYIFVKEYLQRIMGPEILVIDSVEGVSNQLKRVLGGSKLTEVKPLPSLFYITGNTFNRSKYEIFTRNFGLVWGGDF